jgi:hypothetical protein
MRAPGFSKIRGALADIGLFGKRGEGQGDLPHNGAVVILPWPIKNAHRMAGVFRITLV